MEEEALKVPDLVRIQAEESCGGVQSRAREGLVSVERIYGHIVRIASPGSVSVHTAAHSPVAIRSRVVPVSVTPEVEARTVVPSAEPKVIDWSIPTNELAGAVEVIGLF